MTGPEKSKTNVAGMGSAGYENEGRKCLGEKSKKAVLTRGTIARCGKLVQKAYI